MKTKEELNTIKKEVESLSNKLSELSEDELNEVTGGMDLSAGFPTAIMPYIVGLKIGMQLDIGAKRGMAVSVSPEAAGIPDSSVHIFEPNQTTAQKWTAADNDTEFDKLKKGER